MTTIHNLMGRLLVLCMTGLMVLTAHADLIGPYGGLFDPIGDHFVTDQYCFGKRPDAACQIPGHAFDGGGKGVCRHRLSEHSLDSWATLCEPDKSVFRIDRQFPVSPYEGTYHSCYADKPKPELIDRLPMALFRCSSVPRVADRFCRGKQEDDACEAIVVVNGHRETIRGICQENHDELVIEGRRVAARPVLQCESANEVERDYLRVGPPGETHWLCSLRADMPGCVLGWHPGILSTVREFLAAERQRMAWFLTLLMEVPVVLFFARRWRVPTLRALLAGVTISSITHPLAWEAAEQLYTESLWMLAWAMIETTVVAIEAGLMRWWLHLSWRRAGLLSLLANGLTACAGLLL